MSHLGHTTPTRPVKCQICPWTGIRRYGPDGILCQPCPECGRRVTYATIWPGDQPVTPDNGEVRHPSKHRKPRSPEHMAKVLSALGAGRARLKASRTAPVEVVNE
jgi:hypothetical protein